MDLASVLEFVDSGHDLIIGADSSASDLIRDIATECGVDFDEASGILCFVSDLKHQKYAWLINSLYL